VACALALLLGAAQATLGDNDNCADAQPVGDVENEIFDTRDATFDGPGHCIRRSPNIWYCYTASCTGDVTVSLLGSSYDTKLAVYDGCECYPSAGDLIACNDDFGLGTESQVTFAAIAGHQYLVEIGGYDGHTYPSTGRGRLSISCAGDGDVTNLPFDTNDATFDGPGYCMSSPNIWYCYTASCTGDVTVALSGTSYDTMLAAYDGCACYPASDKLIECNDDFGDSTDSQITFAAIAGNQYLIEVGGHASQAGQGRLTVSCEPPSQAGQGRLTVSCEPPVTPVSNDECADAKPIGDVTDLPFDTNGATFDGPGHCMSSPNIWYCYIASCTGNVTVALSGTSYDTMLAAYDGCECYPASDKLIECNDDFALGTDSQITDRGWRLRLRNRPRPADRQL
jgi:hypothetical protein